jgi:hypothetical protein
VSGSHAVFVAHGQRRACRGKRRFSNRGAAEAAIQAEAWHTLDEGVTLSAYKCRCCPGWHLTSIRPGSKRARALVRLGSAARRLGS